MKSLKQAGIDPKKFEFKSAKSASSKYPWDTWLNGEINVLFKGEDFELETDAMPPKIKTAARRRYKTVKISTRDHNGNKLTDCLVIQAFDMTDEERQTEDIKRAEEKDRRTAEREAEKAAATETTEQAA